MLTADDRAGRAGVAPLPGRCPRCDGAVTVPHDPENLDCPDEECPYWPSNQPELSPERISAIDDPEDGAALQDAIAAGSGPQGGSHADNDEPLLVRAGEAARLLGISERHFWQLVQRGEIPVRHLGRRTLVARSAIQKIAAGREPY